MTTRAAAIRSGVNLEYFTVAWNLAEAAAGLLFGAVAGSIALIGFGLDSLIEVSSGGVLLWRLHSDHDHTRREVIEARALKLVGVSLLALALYVAVDSLVSLVRHNAPERSLPGIALAIASLIAISKQTDICAYLSAILLLGLLLNAALDWWWADPLAGLMMVPLIAYEGTQALRGKTCCGNCG